MYVKIGPYTKWHGPYQIADLLKKVGVSEDRCHNIGKWLDDTWVNDLLIWNDSKKKRNIKIKIDKYDTWSLDHTLALIILPALEEFKQDSRGYQIVDAECLPADVKEGTPEAWDWVIDEMIFAFKSKVDDSWEDQFHTGKIDLQWSEEMTCESSGEKFYEAITGPNDTHVFDKEGHDAYQKRISNGFRLFGRFYEGLWN